MNWISRVYDKVVRRKDSQPAVEPEPPVAVLTPPGEPALDEDTSAPGPDPDEEIRALDQRLQERLAELERQQAQAENQALYEQFVTRYGSR